MSNLSEQHFTPTCRKSVKEKGTKLASQRVDSRHGPMMKKDPRRNRKKQTEARAGKEAERQKAKLSAEPKVRYRVTQAAIDSL
eukprot:g34962.t1